MQATSHSTGGIAPTRIALICLVALLAGDALFVSLHLAFVGASQVMSHPLSIEHDGGIPEFFQYAKWLAAALLCLSMLRSQRDWIFLSWAAIFLWFLFDDSWGYHELAGVVIARLLDRAGWPSAVLDALAATGLRKEDFGELCVAIGTALVASTHLIVTWRISTVRANRRLSLLLVAWCGLFATFAVLTDMIHMAMNQTYGLGVLEDAGEMSSLSLLVALLVWVRQRLAAGLPALPG